MADNVEGLEVAVQQLREPGGLGGIDMPEVNDVREVVGVKSFGCHGLCV